MKPSHWLNMNQHESKWKWMAVPKIEVVNSTSFYIYIHTSFYIYIHTTVFLTNEGSNMLLTSTFEKESTAAVATKAVCTHFRGAASCGGVYLSESFWIGAMMLSTHPPHVCINRRFYASVAAAAAQEDLLGHGIHVMSTCGLPNSDLVGTQAHQQGTGEGGISSPFPLCISKRKEIGMREVSMHHLVCTDFQCIYIYIYIR